MEKYEISIFVRTKCDCAWSAPECSSHLRDEPKMLGRNRAKKEVNMTGITTLDDIVSAKAKAKAKANDAANANANAIEIP